MLSTKRAEHLQDILLSKRWQNFFEVFSEITGFNLNIYAENIGRIFSTEGRCPVCRTLLSSPEFRDRCNAYCQKIILKTFNKNTPIIYKCYAKIMSFALPIEYMGEKIVISGQGSFSVYEDLREFIKCLSLSKIGGFSVRAPLKITSAKKAKNACLLLSNSINQFLRNTQEAITLKGKIETIKEVLSLWSVSAKEQPTTLYKYMIANLFTLLEIKYIAILSLDRGYRIYKSLYSLKKNDIAVKDIALSESDLIVQELLRGRPFVSSTDPAIAARARLIHCPDVFYFFPVFVREHMENLLYICDSILKESDINIIVSFCRHISVSIENQSMQSALYKKLDSFVTISEMTKTIAPVLNYEALLQTILDKSAELLKAEQGSLMLLDNETDALLLKAKKCIDDSINKDLTIQKGEGIAGRVAAIGKPLLVKDVENDPRVRQKNKLRYKTRSFISVPITVGGRIIGVLNLSDKTTGEVFNEDDLELIQSFATQAAIIMERSEFHAQTEKLRRLAITDPLTGLLNRRYLYSRLEEEISRSERHGRPMSLLMVDIDGFKDYNDTFGHAMGDTVLKNIANIMTASVRSMDIVSRYGGDEFIIILPETDRPLAVEIAERLKNDIAKADLLPSVLAKTVTISLTASIGVVSYPADGKKSDLLLEKVDRAVYRAKDRGGNTVEVYL